MFDNSFECLWIVPRYFGEYFSVKTNILLFKGARESRVGESVFANSGVDINLPYSSELSLLLLAMVECVHTRFLDRLPRLLLFTFSSETIPFSHFKDIFPPFIFLCSSSYSGHTEN